MATDVRGIQWLFKLWYDWTKIPSFEGYDAYMKALLVCANGDGKIPPAERDYVIGYAAAFGAPAEMLDDLRRYEATDSIEAVIMKAPSLEQTPHTALYDAFRVCAADGHLHEGEVKTIFRMGAALKVPESVTRELHQIHLAEAYLRERRIAVFFPKGNPLA